MNEHTAFERQLKSDIHYKNALRHDMVESIRQLHEWQERLTTIKNHRKEKKLLGTVHRYQAFIDDMRSFLVPLLDDLETSIKEEMKFSEEEIKEFASEVKEETQLAEEARQAFIKARDAADKATDKKLEPEDLQALKDAYSKAWRAFRLEKHKLEEAEEELQSEETDRKIFERELKRIQVERQFIKDV